MQATVTVNKLLMLCALGLLMPREWAYITNRRVVHWGTISRRNL